MQLLIIFWSELILVSGKLETRTLTECKISQKLPNRDSCDYHAHQKAWSLTHDHSSCQVWWRSDLKCDLERWPTAKLARNYPTVTAVITGPWRPSIGMVTDLWPFIMSSLVKIVVSVKQTLPLMLFYPSLIWFLCLALLYCEYNARTNVLLWCLYTYSLGRTLQECCLLHSLFTDLPAK